MNIEVVRIQKPEEINFILGQSHFDKTVEDIHEALIQQFRSSLVWLSAKLQIHAWCGGAVTMKPCSSLPAKMPWRSARGTASFSSLLRASIQ